MYAADAGVERVMQDLLTVPDWNRILLGSVQSSFIDGAPGGTRTLPDGSTIDLTAATNMLNCGKTATCIGSRHGRVDAGAPVDDEQSAMAALRLLAAGRDHRDRHDLSPMYVAVWIADDPAETDGDPTTDGGAAEPARGILMLRAKAFGPNGAGSVDRSHLWRAPNAQSSNAATPGSAARTNRTAGPAKPPCRRRARR